MSPVPSDPPLLSLSVVSHGHGPLVRQLLESLEAHRPPFPLEVILTLNLPEPSLLEGLALGFPVIVIDNVAPAGFAENHNRAFRRARGEYFCVLNPDIVFGSEVFTPLMHRLEAIGGGMVAPRIVDEEGKAQDSYRALPTPRRLLARKLGRQLEDEIPPVDETGLAYPDWIAGMFLLMGSELFAELGGFDEGYFLYLEDVDFGVRCRLAGYSLLVDTGVAVRHDARRDSRRRINYLLRHIASAVRFFRSPVYRRARREGGLGERSRAAVVQRSSSAALEPAEGG